MKDKYYWKAWDTLEWLFDCLYRLDIDLGEEVEGTKLDDFIYNMKRLNRGKRKKWRKP
jgi:hypothetical protein